LQSTNLHFGSLMSFGLIRFKELCSAIAISTAVLDSEHFYTALIGRFFEGKDVHIREFYHASQKRCVWLGKISP
jgi:hypothetical protein